MSSNGHNSNPSGTNPPPSVFSARVIELMQEAVQDAIAEHHRDGRPVSIWEDGRIVLLYPDGTRRPLAEVQAESSPQAA